MNEVKELLTLDSCVSNEMTDGDDPRCLSPGDRRVPVSC
jgi:hypothetical protein